MLLNNENLLKGPFWIISDDGEDYLVAYPIETSTKTPSHKDIWNICRDKIKKGLELLSSRKSRNQNKQSNCLCQPFVL